MQPIKPGMKSTQAFSNAASDAIDDIYDIPSSRETTPASPGKGASQNGNRKDETRKKRKHASAFSSASSTKRQQSVRAHSKPIHEVAAKKTNSSTPSTLPKPSTSCTTASKLSGAISITKLPAATQTTSEARHLLQTKSATLLPSATILSSNNKESLKENPTRSPTPEMSAAPPRRRRLIDALAAQRADSPGSGTESESESNLGADLEKQMSTASVGHSIRRSNHNSPSPQIRLGAGRTPDRRGGPAKSRKIKLTYSSTRSFLGGSQSQNDTAVFEDGSNGLSVPGEEDPFAAPISPPAADFDFEDEIDGPKVGIQSVHELRRAGANNRFSDEMDDLLSRIGKPSSSPSSLRRNALCELANKLQRKEFAGQFRDHAARDNVVKAIGNEEDIISGFALVAALVTFLSFNPAPHLLRQLTTEKVGKLLIRLFKDQRDIEDVSTQKHTNLPRATKSSLTSLKTSILQMDIWHGYSQTTLTPRTLSLQLLVTLSRFADIQCLEKLSQDIEQDITDMAENYIKDPPPRPVDYALIVLALEAQSNLMSLESEKYTAAIKRCLRATLNAWLQQDDALDSTALKLSINITNSEIGASVFDEGSILSQLIHSISQGLSQIQDALQQGTFENKLYDDLLLILGIVINILEHCVSARTSVDNRSLDTAASLWLSNLTFVNDADDVSKSKIGVALGYLAIVLGYLYLTPSGRSQMRERHDWPGTAHLVNSVQDFLQISKSIGNRTNELETLVGDLRVQQAAEG